MIPQEWSYRAVLLIGRFLLAAMPASGQTVLRVDCTTTDPSPDGSSWEQAFPHLQDALATVTGPGTTQIWVAACTYMPDGGYRPVGGSHTPGSGDRTASFQLINNVEIYGGFPTGGGDGTFDARNPDPDTNDTVLSGDLAGNDAPVANPADLLTEPTRAENSYHVVTGSETDGRAVLTGFTITAGNANGSSPNNRGGGMYNDAGSSAVTNCTFQGIRPAPLVGGWRTAIRAPR